MLRMRKSQLDFSRNLVCVREPKWPRDPRAIRGVQMSRRVADVMRECVSMSDGELVFPLYPDRNLSKSCIIRGFNSACDRARVRGVTIHKLRHTFGTRLGALVYSTQEIADLMGHSDIKMARIYVHAPRDRQRSAVEAVWMKRAQVIELGKAR